MWCILGHSVSDVTQNWSHNLQPCAFTQRMPLTLESARSEFLRRVVAGIRGQNGLRVCTCEICHRGALHVSLDGGQEIGVNVALMGPGLHRSHARNLSAIIDVASRDYEQVGIRGN